MTTLTLALNDDHDLHLNAAGNLVVITDLEACTQNCETAMLAQLGEMIYAKDEGIPYRQTSWDQYKPAQFEARARLAISAVTGVEKITGFTISRDGNDLIYVATIQTQWGLGTITNG